MLSYLFNKNETNWFKKKFKWRKIIASLNLETEKSKQQIEQPSEPKQKAASYSFKSVIGDSLKEPSLQTETSSSKALAAKPVIDFSIKREGNQYSMEQNLKSGRGLQIFTDKQLKSNLVLYFYYGDIYS